MTKPKHASLDDMLAGFQLVFFEVIWDAFPWIKSVWIREGHGQFQLFVETTEPQDGREWDDFDYLVREMFEEGQKVLNRFEPQTKHEIKYAIQHGPTVPNRHGYRELMSDKVFKKIAKKHAPWRRSRPPSC